MVIGSTVTATHTLTRTAVFHSTAQSAVLTAPDGTTSTPAVTVDSTADTLSHTYSALLPLTIAGVYTLRWTMVNSDGTTSIVIDNYFASYYDVYNVVRDRLQLSSAIVSDSILDRGIIATIKIMEDRYSTYFVGYANVPIADRFVFDTAMGIISAAYLRPYLPKSTPIGDLIGNKIGPDQFQYADINAKSQKPLDPIEVRWLNEAQTLLDSMAFVQPDILIDNTFKLFVATGSRRNARQVLSLPESTTPDYDLWGDSVTRYEWSRVLTEF